jgi:hypothetical protein
MGRPFKLNRHQQREAIARRDAGEALSEYRQDFWSASHYDRPIAGQLANCVTARPRDFGDADLWRAARGQGPARSQMPGHGMARSVCARSTVLRRVGGS